jgi:L-threonylcarbamoyladenylate synthase
MNDYQAIYDKYHHLVDEIYTNEEPMSEVSSTVVNLTKNPYEIIRIGNISVEDIKKTLSK